MDFEPSERTRLLETQIERFMHEHIYPNEALAREQMEEADRDEPPVLKPIRDKAKALGLWNLFLPDERYGAGLSVLDYAPIAELSGRSVALAPEAMNCAAPDTGNMELLAMFATDE